MCEEKMSFEGKVIIVTGASSGIGADVARHLAKLGGSLALVGRSAYRLSEVADEIESAGGPSPLVISADVTKDAERIIEETVDHFGKLDVLINSAGVGIAVPVIDTDIEDYDRIMDTNMRSIFMLTKLAVPYLEQTEGNIVNVSSLVGLVPNALQPIYSVSKAALNHFTECCAVEFGPKHIRVNAVNPGFVSTQFFKYAGVDDEGIQQLIDDCTSYPVGRVGNVADISNAIAFLASDSASFITGTLMKIDGGAISAGLH